MIQQPGATARGISFDTAFVVGWRNADGSPMASLNGVVLEKKFLLSNQQEPLSITQITAKLEGDVPSQTVTASWEPVKGAVGYYARVWDGTKGLAVSDDAYTLEPSAALPVDVLSPGRAYFVIVVASTLDTVANSPVIPRDFDVSDSIVALPSLSGAGVRAVNWQAVTRSGLAEKK